MRQHAAGSFLLKSCMCIYHFTIAGCTQNGEKVLVRGTGRGRDKHVVSAKSDKYVSLDMCPH